MFSEFNFMLVGGSVGGGLFIVKRNNFYNISKTPA